MIILRKQWCTVYNSKISLYNPCFCQSISRPTNVNSQPQFKAIKAQSRKCQGFSRSLVNFRGHGFVVSNVMTYLLQLTIFARKEAQLWTTSAEYRWIISDILSLVYHFIKNIEHEFYMNSNAVPICKIICRVFFDKLANKRLSENN